MERGKAGQEGTEREQIRKKNRVTYKKTWSEIRKRLLIRDKAE